jgi:hypothetical protein
VKLSRLAWVAAAAIALPQMAHALVIDFSQALGGAAGNTGSGTYSSGPVTAEAFYRKGNNYTNALDKGKPVTLFVRNEPSTDLGFGVCSPEEQSKSQCAKPPKFGGGGGDVNELDSKGTDEMIRLTLASGWTWDHVWLSSLDKEEKGELWISNSPGLNKKLSSFATLYKKYKGTKAEYLDIALTGDAEDTRYLYFIPTGDDNDHLVWKVEVSPIAQVPEADSFVLLAAGLGMLSVLRWRRVAAS